MSGMLIVQAIRSSVNKWNSNYRVADPFSSLGTFSSSSIGGPVFYPIDDCEHPLLYLPGTGIVSHQTAISESFEQNLAGIYNSVWVWWLIMGWIPGWGSLWMVHPFVLDPNLVSVTPSMGILFPILRRNKVSTRWPSFLIFLCFGSCILGILGFWANICYIHSSNDTRDRPRKPGCCLKAKSSWKLSLLESWHPV